DDELVPWAKKRKDIFVSPDRKQIELLKEILEKYPFLATTKKKDRMRTRGLLLLLERKMNFLL
ncbi:MAG: hypothetical protein ACLFO6_01950, partial [Archaeoglobaceae archaeon]